MDLICGQYRFWSTNGFNRGPDHCHRPLVVKDPVDEDAHATLGRITMELSKEARLNIWPIGRGQQIKSREWLENESFFFNGINVSKSLLSGSRKVSSKASVRSSMPCQFHLPIQQSWLTGWSKITETQSLFIFSWDNNTDFGQKGDKSKCADEHNIRFQNGLLQLSWQAWISFLLYWWQLGQFAQTWDRPSSPEWTRPWSITPIVNFGKSKMKKSKFQLCWTIQTGHLYGSGSFMAQLRMVLCAAR